MSLVRSQADALYLDRIASPQYNYFMRYKVSAKSTVRGYAFGEFVRTEHVGRKNYHEGKGSSGSIRGFLLPVFLGVLLLVLSGRLFQVMLFQGEYYRALSDSNRVRTTIIHAPRGIIFDRNEQPLVYNMPGFRKTLNGKTALLDREHALELLAKGDKSLEVDSLRQYPYKEAFSHVVGYIGQISETQLQDPAFSAYQAGDLLGKEGIEQEYEESLRGIDGKKLSEVDATGKPIRDLGTTDPISGRNITTTLDAKLQVAASQAMTNVKKGAVIVSTPKGEILAMVSKPSFDPNLFTLGSGYKTGTTSGYQTVAEVLTDGQSQPLLNRAIGGIYPPGSTFKLVTAIAGLTNNIIDERYQIQDTGMVKIGTFSFGNWYYIQYGKTDGTVDVVKAIKRSNDIFFYRLAEKVGVDTLSKTAAQFGIGKTLGIDLPGEAKGLLPTQSWKKNQIGEQWYLGDTYHYGIGQGYLLTTPLQVNAFTVAIANGGIVYRPRLIEKNENPIIAKLSLSQHTLNLVYQGMRESCAPTGVAWPLFNLKVKNSKLAIDGKNFLAAPIGSGSAAVKKDERIITVACKTGTAQHGGEKDLPHAWITLFAPAENPQVVVTVLNESSGEGSNEAAPIAKKVLEEWFSR